MYNKYFLDQIIILLRHFRESAGLGQLEMANILKVGSRSYQRYESGESIPSIDFLYNASQVLNVKLESFICPEEHLYLIGDVKFFTHENGLPEFDQHLMELMKKFIASEGKFENLDSFTKSTYCMAISNPKTTFLNPSAQKSMGFVDSTISTTLLHSSPMNAGILWGALLKLRPTYFTMQTLIKVPAGHLKFYSENIFLCHNNQYVILRSFETQRLSQPRDTLLQIH